MNPPRQVVTAQIARARPVALAFAPVHKRALGIAVGLVSGLGVFSVTAFHLLFRPANALDIGLLAQYFYGYSVTWRGAGVGFLWGFVTGFVSGWFVAFCRNFITAVIVFSLRTKAELAQTKD